MSLRDVMAYVQKHQSTATPATPPKPVGLQPKPAWIGACTPATPATPHLYEVQAVTPIALPAAPPAPAPEPTDWRELDMAYQVHHVKCPTCIAAGRGVRYGLRCGVGAALWVAYETAARNTPPPWRQPKKGRND